MPTADDYDTAAHTFESVRGRLPALFTRVDAHTSAVVGGRLQLSLMRSIAGSKRRASWCAGELDEVASLCRFRAAYLRHLEEVQRSFELAQLDFRAAQTRWLHVSKRYHDSPLTNPPPGPAPRRPTPPPPLPAWAELRP